jgi:hypothetical protein
VEVTDPTHPLYGRHFPVLRLCQRPSGDGFVLVRYRQHLRLRIPLTATDRALGPGPRSRTKLTPADARRLVALVRECPPCPTPPTPSGPDSPKP